MILTKKLAVILKIGMFLVINYTRVNAKTVNEADTELCETIKMALISSNRKPVDKAITEIYKDDKKAQEIGLTWASFDTEILQINICMEMVDYMQITLKVYPYYRAHNSYGEDEVVIKKW